MPLTDKVKSALSSGASSPVRGSARTHRRVCTRAVRAYSLARVKEADLVIYEGKIVKNRWGVTGRGVPIPDGCYHLTRIRD